MKKLTLVFTSLMILCASSIFASDYAHKLCKKEKFEKIFVNPEQILVRKEGIFVATPSQNKLLQVKFIASENGDLYVAVPHVQLISKRGPCGLHKSYHRKPNGCGGCGVLLCPMNCTCFD